MFRNALLLLAAGFVLVAVAVAEMKTLTLRNGQQMTGEVTETDEGYRVKRAGGLTVVIAADQVVSIADVVPPEQEYKDRLAKIDPKSAEDHYKLGQWAFEEGLLSIASEELQTALKLKSDYERASLLLRQVEARIEQLSRPAEEDAADDETTTSPAASRKLLKDLLVSEEDIYRIRFVELKGTDKHVAITFKNKVLDRFIEMMRGRKQFENPQADDKFRKRSRFSQVIYIRDNTDEGDTAIRDDILIRSDPKFMIDFRNRIWPLVAQHCATAECHGSPKGQGGLKLYSIVGRNKEVDYTNFVILSGFMKSGRRTIDRGQHDLSLLLEYGLSPDQAKYRHSEEIGLVYRSRRSRNYTIVDEWIRSLEWPPYPSYRLKWKPPQGMPINLTGTPDLPETTVSPPAKPEDQLPSE